MNERSSNSLDYPPFADQAAGKHMHDDGCALCRRIAKDTTSGERERLISKIIHELLPGNGDDQDQIDWEGTQVNKTHAAEMLVELLRNSQDPAMYMPRAAVLLGSGNVKVQEIVRGGFLVVMDKWRGDEKKMKAILDDIDNQNKGIP
nr:hypothetical protein [Candidatus Sigynarchaeota archaeon]